MMSEEVETEPRTHTLILMIMFLSMATLGTFQEPFRILVYIGLFGAGIMLGTTIQGIYPDLFRERADDKN